jgi:hypothetical protein
LSENLRLVAWKQSGSTGKCVALHEALTGMF